MAQGTDRDYEALAKEVRYLRDRLDIQDAIHRYSRGLDRLDRVIALSAYHPDATDDRGGALVSTPDEFVGWVFKDIEKAKGTAHNISNITCEVTGDTAHAESYITFHVWGMGNGNGVIFGHARYVDRLERRDGRWAIAHRELLWDYMVNLEAPPPRAGATMPTGLRNKDDRSYARPLALTDDARRRRAEKQAKT